MKPPHLRNGSAQPSLAVIDGSIVEGGTAWVVENGEPQCIPVDRICTTRGEPLSHLRDRDRTRIVSGNVIFPSFRVFATPQGAITARREYLTTTADSIRHDLKACEAEADLLDAAMVRLAGADTLVRAAPSGGA